MGWKEKALEIITQILNRAKPQPPPTTQIMPQSVSTPASTSEPQLAPGKPIIDWTDPNSKVSKYFTVKEMIFLPTWNRLANESDGLNDTVKANLIDLAKTMDVVREYFNLPVKVHVAYRPTLYNKIIGGASKSAHIDGMAIDFHFVGLDCDAARKKINDNGLLETWQVRMEDISHLSSRGWVHLDRRQPPAGGKRFFKP